MARTRWPSGPVNPGLLPRPGRSDRQRRWVPQKPGPGRQIDSQDSPSGVSRFGGQAGTQATDPTPPPDQSQGGRAGSTTHILPAYYACYGPRRSSTADLAWIAGSRWHIEECSQQAKGEAGLDHYQVRSWRAWYAHITLSMLALAWLAASRAQAEKRGSAPATQA
jgi:hypothetical protein